MSEVTTGGDVDAYCGKCQLVLAHVVIAMRGALAARVECKTCHHVHAYRTRAATRKAVRGLSRPNAAAVRAASSHTARYQERLRDRDAALAKAYHTTQQFQVDDLISHPKFLLGVVDVVQADHKITVIFQDKIRILIHAGC